MSTSEFHNSEFIAPWLVKAVEYQAESRRWSAYAMDFNDGLDVRRHAQLVASHWAFMARDAFGMATYWLNTIVWE